jgi:hypothetical protein
LSPVGASLLASRIPVSLLEGHSQDLCLVFPDIFLSLFWPSPLGLLLPWLVNIGTCKALHLL